jgi:hypothetical protein
LCRALASSPESSCSSVETSHGPRPSGPLHPPLPRSNLTPRARASCQRRGPWEAPPHGPLRDVGRGHRGRQGLGRRPHPASGPELPNPFPSEMQKTSARRPRPQPVGVASSDGRGLRSPPPLAAPKNRSGPKPSSLPPPFPLRLYFVRKRKTDAVE